MAALDAPTQPRIARSRQRRCPAPPPRRAITRSATTIGVELPRTVQRVAPPVVPTSTLLRPSSDPELEPIRSRRWIGVLVGALAAGLATGGALAVSGVGVLPVSRSGPTATQALGAVQRLGPQQSAAQTVQKTFVVDQSSLLDFGRRVQYRAVGQAQATVDLGAVRASDVEIRGTRATVRIPAAQLDPPVIDDSSSSFVNNRDRSILPDALGGSDITSADVQPQAEQQLSDAAQAQGIPNAAQQLAMARVRATLRRLGFSTVAVRVSGA
jgi:Protein of unknown function (DUF4230)